MPNGWDYHHSRILTVLVVPFARRGVLFAAILSFSLMLLASCAQQSDYHPYSPRKFLGIGGDGTGYSESPVRADVYEVGYNGSNNPTECRYLATVRAAEIALLQGKPYFEIVQAFPGESPGTWALLNHATSQPATAALAAATINTNGNIVNLDNPTSALLIQLLSDPTTNSLSAVTLLRQAQQKGIKLSAETQSRINASTQPTGAH